MKQLLLFPDPRPLVERLGRSFFLGAPQTPGVYLMRDKSEMVVYVGKAINLRKRLACYRVANPDRMPRRHLQMLRHVVSISFESCSDEQSALRRESELLLQLKPRYNRAGTWTGPTYHLLWRGQVESLQFKMHTECPDGWRTLARVGKGRGTRILGSLSRLLWCALYPARCMSELPAGWLRDRFTDEMCCLSGSSERVAHVASLIGAVCDGEAWQATASKGLPGSDLCEWLRQQTSARTFGFERAILDEDLDMLERQFLPAAREP